MSPRILKHASAAALVGAGLSLGFAAPTYAQGASCGVNGATLFAAGYTCTAGDKLYSEFTILQGGTTLAGTTNFFVISDNDPSHTLSAVGNYGVGTYAFSYKMEIVGPNLATREFGSIKTGATTSIIPPPPNTWTKTLAAVPVTAPGSVVSTETSVGGESTTAAFADGIKSAVFTSTLNVTGGVVTGFSDSMTQDIIHNDVPGPLPILGAGMAFGFSRKLRRRVSAAN